MMKPLLFLLAVLLAVGPVNAGPTGPMAVNGVIHGAPPAKHDVVEERTERPDKPA